MKQLLFEDDPQFWFETLRVFGHASYGGSDFGEVVATASRIKPGDYDSWHDEWLAAAERLAAEADGVAAAHPISARDAYLRASTYYRSAEFFLHGNPADPRIAYAYDRSVECFHRAIEGFAGVERVEIPYEGHVLRGYFYRAPGTGRCPILVAHNGFDGSAEEVHFFGAAGGQERGYHVLAFDGPGQPRAIHRDGLVFRPDWEHVVGPVLDFVLADPGVDPDKVALLGLSLGGMLAPRAAAFDERIKAVVAVDGVFDAGSAVTAFLPWDRAEIERRANAPHDEELDNLLAAGRAASPTLRWATDHGRYVTGAATDREFLAKYLAYTLDGGVAERIKCPALVCEAADDLFFNGDGETQPEPRRLYERLTGPKTLLSFTAEEGADAHCHVGAQRLATARVFDWLDETL
ncbi:S9 family peptidase [Amycolatopsis sp. DSM 110486]|uniref:alpha/beta hydrolase family protein n=1 Tax=Amycolatopsis sp. DSM 110486 TaxID=2865832 RepID=UPI001C6A6191|nr:alpha/beta fold hydrolase [Amycolatopsis sp. DSM 110486]QYN22570.1 alpha/beta fold hydrolase [Amycolatopsis sp. DSM 110486]